MRCRDLVNEMPKLNVSKNVLIEGFRRGVLTGTGLDRKHLRQKVKGCVCKWCAQATNCILPINSCDFCRS